MRLVLLLAMGGLAACGGGTSANRPPVLEDSGPLTVVEGQRLAWSPAASDPDGDPVRITYSGWSVLPSRIAADPGEYAWTAVAEDGRGGVARTTVEVRVLPDTSPGRTVFAMQATDPSELPFPNDYWTTPGLAQVTGLTVNLPLPSLAEPSKLAWVVRLNQLDGFSTRPRIVVPTEGVAPDAATVDAQSLYLVGLEPAEIAGEVVPLDQRVVDLGTGPGGGHRLIATPQRTLREASRYALVMTAHVTAGGRPIARSAALNRLLYAWQSGQSATSPHQAALFQALGVLRATPGVPPDELGSLAVFTTRSLSPMPLKLRGRLESGAFPLAPLDFDVDPQRPGIESWPAAQLVSIAQWLHRASRLSQGTTIAYAAGSLDIAGALGDDPADVWIENARTGQRIQVPQANVTPLGAVTSTDVTALAPQPGDELALLARGVSYSSAQAPWRFDGVGRIAFWTADVPLYTDASGQIPLVPSGPFATPPQTGTDTVLGLLLLPGGPTPPGGFRVANYAHGGGTAFEAATFVLAGPLAQSNIATLAFNATGHGGGPRSFLEVTAQGGDTAELRASGLGRSRDLTGEGIYGTSEGLNVLQRWSDIMAVVRSAHLGADADGVAGSELTSNPARTYQHGISYGGQTTLGIAAYATSIGAAVANVAGTGQFASGYLTALGRSRDTGAALLEGWQPAPLLNGDDPRWGGGFTEDVPWPGEPVQQGLVSGAEEIQWAFAAQEWHNAHMMPPDFLPLAASGAARGGERMPLLLQISRGDGESANTLQYHFVENGDLADSTCLVRFDAEPAYDSFWTGFGVSAQTARHLVLGLPHNGNPFNLAGRLCDDLRQQLVDFLASGGQTLLDPDPTPPGPYAGDVFEVPLSITSLEALADDPGF